MMTYDSWEGYCQARDAVLRKAFEDAHHKRYDPPGGEFNSDYLFHWNESLGTVHRYYEVTCKCCGESIANAGLWAGTLCYCWQCKSWNSYGHDADHETVCFDESAF